MSLIFRVNTVYRRQMFWLHTVFSKGEYIHKKLPLETKNTLQIEHRSLGFIETLHKGRGSTV